MKLFLLTLSVFLLGSSSERSFGQKPAIGAIRWDAWIGDLGEGLVDANNVGLQVEKTLGPHRYHYRAPFFSKEISYDSIQTRGATQKIMDEEIRLAKSAGIDYWAFCWYPFHSGLDTARTLYLASKHTGDVKWCVILGTNPFRNESDAPWLVKRFKENNYQKVAGGRPLVYIFQKIELKVIDRIRDLCKEQGVPPPYVVVMDFVPATAKAMAETLKADALSSYKSAAGKNGEPYFPVLPKADSINWERYSKSGMKIVPWVTTGRNTKPRIDHPVRWATVPPEQWVADGTPEQIADDLANCLQWTKTHTEACEANAIIMYAWNEFDEGGWICPTFGNDHSRLDAIRKVIKGQ
ncbi:MAG TPA: hypothetical protein VGM30_23640 [Puia sp.]|jgi:hypothetical protein